ncbi:MAG: hypothetical protein JSS22_15155 [Proteobacteria bacterium]|nr:hypothetical protein [Pseudomonadota bacterium]
MSKATHISDNVARSLLWPGTAACHALGLDAKGEDYSDLIRMLINSLVWTVAGVIVVAVII